MPSSHDKYLDSNYRIKGDRIVTERTHQNEQMIEGIGLLIEYAALIPIPRLARLIIVLIAEIVIFPISGATDSSTELFFKILLLAVGGLLLYALMPIVLLITVCYFLWVDADWGWAVGTFFLAPIGIHWIRGALAARQERARSAHEAAQNQVLTGDSQSVPLHLEATNLSRSTHPSTTWRRMGIFLAICLLAVIGIRAGFRALPQPTPTAAQQVNTDATGPAMAGATGARGQSIGTASAASVDSAQESVRSFYLALGHGDGVTANSYMSLEKRAAPAYQPDAIAAFYGHMAEPLTLVSVSKAGAEDYEVRYRYRKQSAVCNGHAIVTTQESGGRTLIARIRPVGNC